MDNESQHMRGLLTRAEDALVWSAGAAGEEGTSLKGRFEVVLLDFLRARQQVAEVLERVTSMKDRCRRLAEYYSIGKEEGGGEGVFFVFRDFVETFNQTVEELAREAKRKKREAQKEEKEQQRQSAMQSTDACYHDSKALPLRGPLGEPPVDPMAQFELSLQNQWTRMKANKEARRSSMLTKE
jgi:hypothetical protein